MKLQLGPFEKVFVISFLIVAVLSVLVVVNSERASTQIGFMGNAEMPKIVAVRFIDGQTTDIVQVVVRNEGHTSIRIANGFVNGVESNSISSAPAFITGKYCGLITLGLKSNNLTEGMDYRIMLITAKGSSVAFNSTYNSIPNAQQNTLFDNPLPTPYPLATESPSSIPVDHRWNQFVTAISYAIIVTALSTTLVVYLKKRKSVFTTDVALLALAFDLVPFWFPSTIYLIRLSPLDVLLGILLVVLSYSLIHIMLLAKRKEGTRALCFAISLAFTIFMSFFIDALIIAWSDPFLL